MTCAYFKTLADLDRELERWHSVQMVYLFDTSGVNWLHDDEACGAIVNGLLLTGTVRVSALNVLEAARTSERARRLSLLRLLKHMTGGERPLEMPNTLVRRGMTAYAARQVELDYSIDADADVLWNALVDPESVDQDTRTVLSDGQKTLEADFRLCHRNARPHFQELFADGGKPPRHAPALLRAYMRHPRFIHDVVSPLYREATGTEIAIQDLDELFLVLPELAGLLLGWGHSVHQRAISQVAHGPENAGIFDLWFGTYFGRVDRFITADVRQYRALRLVAKIVSPSCQVMQYAGFRRRLLGEL